MVKAELCLAFGPIDRGLFHPTGLYPQVIPQTKTQSQIRSVSIEILYLPVVTDICLAIDKYFIIQRQVNGPFFQSGIIKRHV